MLSSQVLFSTRSSWVEALSQAKEGPNGSKAREDAAWIEHANERACRCYRDWENGPGDDPAY